MTTRNGGLANRLATARGWDNLLRQLMLAGNALIPLESALRNDDHEVKGCQSRVWLDVVVDQRGKLTMLAWSDSKIIRGVLAVIQEHINQLHASDVATFNFEDWFRTVQLERYLSQSRASGIAEVVSQIRRQARK